MKNKKIGNESVDGISKSARDSEKDRVSFSKEVSEQIQNYTRN